MADENQEERPNPRLEQAKSYVGQTVDDLVDRFRTEYPNWEPDVLRAWCLGKTQLDQNFLTARYLFRMSWQDIVAGIKCPTLLVTADQPGGIVSQETALKVTEMNGQISHVHISGTGHHIRFANYEDYFTAFTNFLNNLD